MFEIQDLMLVIFLFPIGFYFFYRKFSNPPTIFIGVLSLQYLVYLVFSPEYYPPLSDAYEQVLLIALWAFFIGYVAVLPFEFLGAGSYRVRLRYCPIDLYPKRLLRFYAWASLLSVIVFFGHAYVGVSNGLNGGYSFWVNVRMTYLENKESFGLLPHIAIVLQVYFACCLLCRYKGTRSLLFFLLVTLAPVVFKLERTSLLTSLMALLVIFENSRRNGIQPLWLLISLILFIFFFLLVAFQFAPDRPLLELAMVLVNYFSKNLMMLDRYVLTVSPTGDIAPLLGPYAKLFGMSSNNNLFVDGAFNTYSFIKVPYLYGGGLFLGFFCFSLGVFSSSLYLLRYKFGGYVLIFYGFWSVSLLLSFFDYTYAWSNWLYYGVAALMFYFYYGSLLKSEKRC